MSDRPEEEQAVIEEAGGSASHADVGGKVNAIIQAAEAAAEEMGARARRDADQIMKNAEKRAASRIEELTRDATKAKTEADQYARDITDAADSYGTQHRRTTEEEARTLLADAEKRAKEMLDGAEKKADEIERDVVQRHETLQREMKMLEERKQRVLESLRDLAAQLQDALAEPTEGAGLDDSLMGALEVEPRR
jgi:peptidoglycan DL-endopeptidase RipA